MKRNFKGMMLASAIAIAGMIGGIKADAAPANLPKVSNLYVVSGLNDLTVYKKCAELEVSYGGDDYIKQLILNKDTPEKYDVDDYTIGVQVDYSIKDANHWQYNSNWDKGETSVNGKNRELIYNDIKYDEDTQNVIGSARIFSFGDEEDADFCDAQTGYLPIIGTENIFYRNINGAKYPDIDYCKVAVYVRARYIVEYYNGRDAKFVCGPWSDVVKYGEFGSVYSSDELLKNPDFEYGLDNWQNPSGSWISDYAAVGKPANGRYYAWPAEMYNFAFGDTNPETYIYQDVDISGYSEGESVVFNAMMSSCVSNDNNKSDMAKAALVFYDKDGKDLSSYAIIQTGNSWNARSIVMTVPKDAVKLRVVLSAIDTNSAGGLFNYECGLFDKTSLRITKEKVNPVVITEPNNTNTAKRGDVLHLTANNGISSNPTDYVWTTSSEAVASVNESGVVTVNSTDGDGAVICATDRVTGIVGAYYINMVDPNKSEIKSDNGDVLTVTANQEAELTVPKVTKGKIKIPDSVKVDGVEYKVTSVADGAFKKAAVTEITIGKNVTKIGKEAFSGCNKLTKVTLNSDVTEIGDNAFNGCTKLTSITLPKNVTSIGTKAFYGCKALKSVVVPDKVVTIGSQAFKGCTSMTTVKIGKRVQVIDDEAFSGCSKLSKVTIGASVKTIGNKAFYGCKALKSVTIPAKVTKIGKSAFEKCSALKTVTIKTKSVTFGSKCFKSINSKAKVTAPKKLKNAAKLIKKAGVSGKSQTIKVK